MFETCRLSLSLFFLSLFSHQAAPVRPVVLWSLSLLQLLDSALPAANVRHELGPMVVQPLVLPAVPARRGQKRRDLEERQQPGLLEGAVDVLAALVERVE